MRSELDLGDICAIFFDLDGTLRHSRPSYNDAFFAFIAEKGLSVTDTSRRQALRWAHYYFAGSPEMADDNLTFGDDQNLFMINYVRRWLISCGCEPSYADQLAEPMVQHMRNTLQPEDWVSPDVPSTLQSLKEAGFTLGVVSNRSEAYGGLLEELGLASYFEFSIAAGVVDSWKPDSRIFEHALQRAETSAERTIYVGDNYYADVIGAQRAGLQPVLFDPEGVFPDAECPVIHAIGELQHDLA